MDAGVCNMHWFHDVDSQWMEARRDVITASEIASCISAYNRAPEKQKAGNTLFPAFAALWAKKQAEGKLDTYSSGLAARGHILEPFAIDDWNAMEGHKQYYHWDDIIIMNNGIGWSPDGLDVPQETYEPKICEVNGKFFDGTKSFEYDLPKSFIEIKSYSPENVIKKRLTMPDKLDERWQMACAFVTVPSLETGILLFYSIDTNLSFHVEYTRDSLEKEIKQVKDMVSLWNKNVVDLNAMPTLFNRRVNEQQVYDHWHDSLDDVLSF